MKEKDIKKRNFAKESELKKEFIEVVRAAQEHSLDWTDKLARWSWNFQLYIRSLSLEEYVSFLKGDK